MSRPVRYTPFHAAATLFLLAGLALAAYHGLAQFDLVPAVGWVAWSHVHYVTVGAFTQLILGTLPQLAAHRLDRPAPGRRFTWASFAAVNGGFLALWYGRAYSTVLAFDIGITAIFLAILALLLVVLRMALESPDGWDATVALFLLSPFVFLWGIAYGYGLWGHVWSVPGGWYGLREAHVHANAWGFLAFAAVGTLYAAVPRLVDAPLASARLRDRSIPLFALGIFPLITGPWLGMGRTVTATGLLLYGAGYVLYVTVIVRTYRAGTPSGFSLGLVVSQFWLLAPAIFAPFVLFGLQFVPTPYVEQAALHFFFVGWALPLAFAGLSLTASRLPILAEDTLDPSTLPSVPTWAVGAWNGAVLLVGIGFLTQDYGASVIAFGVGYAVIAALWLAVVLTLAAIPALATPETAPD